MIIFIAFCTIIFQETGLPMSCINVGTLLTCDPMPPVILVMTLYEGFKVSRFSTSQYLRRFYRDGIFYYLYIFREPSKCVSLSVSHSFF